MKIKPLKPREYTNIETRKMLFDHLNTIIQHWTYADHKNYTVQERIEGAIFTFLSTLDGCSLAVPGFHVIPCPAEEDKDFHVKQGENYFPRLEGKYYDEACKIDIGGVLHDQFAKHLGYSDLPASEKIEEYKESILKLKSKIETLQEEIQFKNDLITFYETEFISSTNCTHTNLLNSCKKHMLGLFICLLYLFKDKHNSTVTVVRRDKDGKLHV